MVDVELRGERSSENKPDKYNGEKEVDFTEILVLAIQQQQEQW